MLPGMPTQSGSAEEKRLRKLFRALQPGDQATLLRFAEFLTATPASSEEPLKEFPTPEIVERPAEESVVKAIRRLTSTYPMVDRDRLLNETSSLMSAHVLHGKSANDVIDELEALFLRHYQILKDEFERNL